MNAGNASFDEFPSSLNKSCFMHPRNSFNHESRAFIDEGIRLSAEWKPIHRFVKFGHR